MKNHTRTIKVALERKLGVGIPSTHDLLTWIVSYACLSYNRYHVGPDGRTPQERIMGRKVPPPQAHFGESVWYKPLCAQGRPPPLEERYRAGFMVSYVSGSNQCIVANPDGAVRCRAIKRRPPCEQWSSDILNCHCSFLQPDPLNPGETRAPIRIPMESRDPENLDAPDGGGAPCEGAIPNPNGGERLREFWVHQWLSRM